jgi:hypothetical protein
VPRSSPNSPCVARARGVVKLIGAGAGRDSALPAGGRAGGPGGAQSRNPPRHPPRPEPCAPNGLPAATARRNCPVLPRPLPLEVLAPVAPKRGERSARRRRRRQVCATAISSLRISSSPRTGSSNLVRLAPSVPTVRPRSRPPSHPFIAGDFGLAQRILPGVPGSPPAAAPGARQHGPGSGGSGGPDAMWRSAPRSPELSPAPRARGAHMAHMQQRARGGGRGSGGQGRAGAREAGAAGAARRGHCSLCGA